MKRKPYLANLVSRIGGKVLSISMMFMVMDWVLNYTKDSLIFYEKKGKRQLN